MEKRFWLCRRGGSFYVFDSETGRRESLRTRDPHEAQRLLAAKIEATEQPRLNIAIARAYLAASDARYTERTWEAVMTEFESRGKPTTRIRRQRGLRATEFDHIRNKKLIETTADDFREVLGKGGTFSHLTLRCLHNLALGLGWLPWPILPPKLWPSTAPKPKRGLTAKEHEAIIGAEKNVERRTYYQLLWEIGGSQSDVARLTNENIDWTNQLLTYERQKTGEVSSLRIGKRLEELLRQLPSHGPLFPVISQTRDKDRSAEFRRRCRLLKIEGVSLHSYRYAWAERAKSNGYPERFAQAALGHNSKAVHRAYARGARMTLPSIEDYENQRQQPVAQSTLSGR